MINSNSSSTIEYSISDNSKPKKYLYANIRIPVEVQEDGSFIHLQEYAVVEFSKCDKLPELNPEPTNNLSSFLNDDSDSDQDQDQEIIMTDTTLNDYEVLEDTNENNNEIRFIQPIEDLEEPTDVEINLHQQRFESTPANSSSLGNPHKEFNPQVQFEFFKGIKELETFDTNNTYKSPPIQEEQLIVLKEEILQNLQSKQPSQNISFRKNPRTIHRHSAKKRMVYTAEDYE